MNQLDYITKSLLKQDRNITIDKIEGNDYLFSIFAHLSLDEELNCPKCHSTHFTKNSTYQRKIKCIKVNDIPIIMYLNQDRYKCCECSKSFNQPSDFIKKGCNISNEIKNQIIKETAFKQSFKDISYRTNVSETTISNEFKAQLHEYRCELTRVMCLDEFNASTIAGKYAFIIGDPETRLILDVLPSRQLDYIYYYFQTISIDERKKVEYIVTDLYEAYRTLCKNLFHQSIHVADRFHWIKLASEAFNKTRIRLMNQYLKLGNDKTHEKRFECLRLARLLKSSYKLFLCNKYRKETWFYDQPLKTQTNEYSSYQTLMEYCLNQDQTLEEAYFLLQEVYRISVFCTELDAREQLLNWCEKVENSEEFLPDFKRTALTYRSWIKEIVNSFKLDPVTHKRLSNGFIEGENNFVKSIKRVGYGYKDFDTFRARILQINKKINK